MRVLFVDDYVDSADALSAYLKQSGIDARATGNGCDALSLAATRRPAAMVLEIGMPAVSGLTVALPVRRIAKLAGISLLAYVATDQGDGFAAIRDSGFDAKRMKPIEPACLIRLLAQITRNQQFLDGPVDGQTGS